ncbi:MAG: HipA domain-containing protein [Lachnospiraceae bacterium]|nr:HipA domain-containing protein [Lachnospiraceae bacterium]
MEKYLVNIERRGEWVNVGTIEGNDSAQACFRYSDEYLNDPASAPISISLPLTQEAYSAQTTKLFFEGLLPEGFTRRAVAGWMRTDEDDYLALLYGLGRECLGALRICRDEQEDVPSYERLSMEQVRALAAEGATKSAELVTKAHISLTGASGKVGLYRDEREDAWYLSHGTASSTHIVKQSHIRLGGIVANEQLVQLTAKKLGIDVPQSSIINTGSGADGEVLFATKRYDRVQDPVDTIDGLPRQLRLHQEDFAQALGISAAAKYEKDASDMYMKKVFDLLRRVSANPIEDLLRLWDRVVFCYLIGNTDSHIKNISVLYGQDLKGIRLAPAYDLLSTSVYESSTRDMAFYIGGVCSLDEIDEAAFERAAKEIGIGARMAMNRFADIRKRLVPALNEAANELAASGFVRAQEIARRILATGGIAKYLTE